MTQRTLGGLFDAPVAAPSRVVAHIDQVRHLLPRVNYVAPRLSDLPSWANAERVCIDVESCDPMLTSLGPGFRRGAFIVGIAFAIEDGPEYYLPVAHEGGDNLDRAKVIEYIRDQLSVFQGDLVAANAGYELEALEREWDIMISRRIAILDPLVYAPVIDGTHLKYNLDDCLERAGLPLKDETILREAAAVFGWSKDDDVKANLWRLPARYVDAYARGDVRLPLQLLRRQEKEIEAANLGKAIDLETRVLPVCHRMRARGMRVDLDLLERITPWALAAELEAMSQVGAMAGVRLTEKDTMRSAVLVPIIEQVTGIKIPRGESPKTGKPTFELDADILGEIDHPIAKLIRRARVLNKVRTTFCKQVREHAIHHGDHWRVHCTFNQVRATAERGKKGKGTRTYRLSSTDFNKQNQPTRSEIPVQFGDEVPRYLGTVWRSIFLADQNSLLASLDYSQQEPRVECHFALGSKLRGAADAAENWWRNPWADSHQMVADMTGLPRKRAKEVRLGLGYRMGGAKLCKKYLRVPTEWVLAKKGPRKGQMIEVAGPEGKAIMDRFNEGAPYISALSQLAEEVGNQRGYVITLGGHHIVAAPGDERKYGNYLIQGSAAGQTKMAMVALDDMGVFLQDQIHDEVNFSFTDLAQVHDAQREMENVIQLRVPVVVSVEVGDNWGEVEEVPWVRKAA